MQTKSHRKWRSGSFLGNLRKSVDPAYNYERVLKCMGKCMQLVVKGLEPLRCIYNIITLERVRRISDASRCEVTAVSDLDLLIRRLANEMLVI